MKDTDLLQFIHKTAAMGVEGLCCVEGQIRNENLLRAVREQIAEYREISKTSGELLREVGHEPSDPNLMAKISSEVMARAKTFGRTDPSKIAEMVIQGNNMGITKGIKHLHDYHGDDPRILSLAHRLLATEQANVEQMQQYL